MGGEANLCLLQDEEYRRTPIEENNLRLCNSLGEGKVKREREKRQKRERTGHNLEESVSVVLCEIYRMSLWTKL